MELSQFFLPVHTLENDQESVGQQVGTYFKQFPEWKSAKLAFFTVSKVIENDFQLFRKQFYQLKELSRGGKLVDLGHLDTGETMEITAIRLQEVCTMLLAKEIFPLVIADEHFWDVPVYESLHILGQNVSVTGIDAEIDLHEHHTDLNKRHLHQILLHQPNYLSNYAHLGHQRYLIARTVLAAFEKLNFEAVSLGSIRDHISEVEPYIRQSQFLTFDLAALRSSDLPANDQNRPFGLTPDEAAQLCWYAGQNGQLQALFLGGYHENQDGQVMSAHVLAVLIWYVLEGFLKRNTDEPEANPENFTKYNAVIDARNQAIVFYKHKQSGQWWLEAVYEYEEAVETKLVLPCSENDYFTALQGELPSRWIRAVNRLL